MILYDLSYDIDELDDLEQNYEYVECTSITDDLSIRLIENATH